MSREEEWHAELHPDVQYTVVKPKRHRKLLGRKMVLLPDEAKAKKDAVDRTWVVCDRLTQIMSRSADGKVLARQLPMVFQVDADAPPRLTFDIYYSASHIDEHAPLREEDGSIRADVERWPFQFADLPDLEKEGFGETVVSEDGREVAYYTVEGIVEIKAQENHLDVCVQILCPGEDLKYCTDPGKARQCLLLFRARANHGPDGNDTEELLPSLHYRVCFRQTTELWDGKRPHCVSEWSRPVKARSNVQRQLPSPSAMEAGSKKTVHFACDEKEPPHAKLESPLEKGGVMAAVDLDSIATHATVEEPAQDSVACSASTLNAAVLAGIGMSPRASRRGPGLPTDLVESEPQHSVATRTRQSRLRHRQELAREPDDFDELQDSRSEYQVRRR